MFRGTQKKPRPASSSNTVLIDPSVMDAVAQQRLDFMLADTDQDVFLKGVPYSLVESTSARRAKETILACALTDTVIRLPEKTSFDPAFAVISHEFRLADMTTGYRVDGFLYRQQQAGFLYAATQHPHFIITFERPINPYKMTEQPNRLLASILHLAFRQERSSCFFPAGRSCQQITDDAGNHFIVNLNLKYPILAREREHYPDEIRYEVLGECVGSGAFAAVYKTLMTLIPQSNGCLERKFVPRKVKHIQNGHGLAKELVDQEYHFASMTPHQHVKRIVRDPGQRGQEAFMVGRLLPGRSLYSHFKAERDRSLFSVAFRWRVSSAMLAAYLDQVAAVSIKHRDIKDGNILLDTATSSFPQVFIIDYAFSEPAHTVSSRTCGTPFYAAPEIYRKDNITVAVDYFALGVVLARIWNLVAETDAVVPSRALLSLRMQQKYGDEEGFSDDLCHHIVSIICDLVADKVECRSEPLAALKRVDALRVQYMMAQLPRHLGEALLTAHRRAAALRIKLRELFSIASREGGGISKMVLAVAESIEPCQDLPVALHEFVSTLGVVAFQREASCKAIVAKAINIAGEYMGAGMHRLEVLSRLGLLIAGRQFSLLHRDYQHYLRALQKSVSAHADLTPSSFDDVVVLTEKANKDVERVLRELGRVASASCQALMTVNPDRPWRHPAQPVPLRSLIAFAQQAAITPDRGLDLDPGTEQKSGPGPGPGRPQRK